jgi:L-threonylcarbamoyladenylate synthase
MGVAWQSKGLVVSLIRTKPIGVDEAVVRLARGEVVALPSETVYGLAADALDAKAVAQIFQIKGRPSTNPLIVHVPSGEAAKRLTSSWPDSATLLAGRFWPGPLTMVLPKASHVPDEVTAGRNTVAIRVPSHPVFLEVLEKLNRPLAAPSANRSNHISPTSARHVIDEFGDAVPVVDGGSSQVGIESTVIDLSSKPTILRPGIISRSQIEDVIGPVELFAGHVDAAAAATSPGQQLKHYSPRCATIAFDRGQLPVLGPRSCAMVIGNLPPQMRTPNLLHYGVLSSDPVRAAAKLYSVMRYLDALNPSVLAIEMPPTSNDWAAVRDRVMRAAGSGVRA